MRSLGMLGSWCWWGRGCVWLVAVVVVVLGIVDRGVILFVGSGSSPLRLRL